MDKAESSALTLAGSDPSGNLKDGDRRIVTVVFTDMVDFTKQVSGLDPEETDQMMSQVFERFEQIVRRHEGSVEKYIGDALVAVFGVPIIHEDDAVRALNAALDFSDALVTFNLRLEQRKLPPIQFRTGINTGLITTGRRGDFDVVTGHTMNVASRIQQNAAPGKILVSRNTVLECGRDFIFSSEFSIAAKGIQEEIPVSELKDRSDQYLAEDELFVGRKRLLDELVKSYLRHDGSSPGYLITGDAGMGKTALVRSFLAKLRSYPDSRITVLWARARKFRTIPFAVISDLVVNYCHLDIHGEEAEIADCISCYLDLPVASTIEFAHLLHEEGRVAADTTQIFSVISTQLRQILSRVETESWPTVVFIDNSMFLDHQSRDFLSWFVKNTQPLPFFVFVEREPRIELSEAVPGLIHRELSPLSPEESRELFDALVQKNASGHKPEPEDRDNFLRNAEGNPLFIRAYARWLETGPQGGEIPQSMQNLFLATVSRYNSDIRDLLTKLSVFHHNFSLADAQYIQRQTEGDDEIVQGALLFFEQEEILWRQGLHYYFRHEVFKKALYNSLLNYNKKILHQLVVNLMLEQSAPNSLRLIHHLIRSEHFRDAADRILRDPGASINRDFLRSVDTLLASEIAGDKPLVLELQFLKAAILFNHGQNDEANEILRGLLFSALENASSDHAAAAYHLLCAFNMKSYRFQKADHCGMKAIAHYRNKPDKERHMASVYNVLALNATVRNRPEQAEKYLDALHEFSSISPTLAAREQRVRMKISLMNGEYRKAAGYWEQLSSNTDFFEDEEPLCSWYRLDLEKFRDELQEFLDKSAMILSLSHGHALMASTLKILGEGTPQRVQNHIEQAEFYAMQSRNDLDRIDALKVFTEALFENGELEKAERLALEAAALAERHSIYTAGFSLLVLLMEIYERKGDKDRFAFFAKEAKAIEGLGPLTERRDRILYHGLTYAVSGDESSKTLALALLCEEASECARPESIERLLRQRSYAKIATSCGFTLEGCSADAALKPLARRDT